MKKSTLRIAIAVEVVLFALACIAGAGIFLYNGGLSAFTGPVNATTQPELAAATQAAAAPTLEETPTAGVDFTATPETEPTSRPDGSQLQILPNETTQYTDNEAGFEMLFPKGWLALRPNSDEFHQMLTGRGAFNLMLKTQMEADQAGYDKTDRLYAYILHSDIKGDVLFGFSKLTFDPNNDKPLNSQALGEVVRGMQQNPSTALPGFRVAASNIFDNPNQVKVLMVKGRFALKDDQGNPIPFVASFYYFKPTPGSLARISFSYLQDYDKQFSAEIEEIISSVKLPGK